TDAIEQVGAPQLLGDRDWVGRLALAVQRLDRLVDVAVRRLVEVAALDVRLHGRGDRVARAEHGPGGGPLCLEVVRWDAAGRAPPPRLDRLDHCRRSCSVAPTPGRHSADSSLWIDRPETLGISC